MTIFNGVFGRYLGAGLIMLGGGLASGNDTASRDWKTDCVGRMQIDLPGDVFVAAETASSWDETGFRAPRFPDEEVAPYSKVLYLGELDVSHQWSNEYLEKQLKRYEQSRTKFRVGGETQEKFGPRTFQELSTSPMPGVGWQFGDTYYAILRVGQVLVSWTGSGYETGSRDYQRVVANLRPRATFDAPKEPGVCLPYLFAKDDGRRERRVGMTYRLKDHPDITVWLEDSSAATVGPNQDPAKFTAAYRAYFFWNQDYQDRNSMRSLLPFEKSFEKTTLAGQPALKTFIELTRTDDVTKDFGYLVAARGDPDAKEDRPDLMLYVIQDSLNARKRGIEPLGKDAFYKLAETIAASVKRREETGR